MSPLLDVLERAVSAGVELHELGGELLVLGTAPAPLAALLEENRAGLVALLAEQRRRAAEPETWGCA